MKHSLNDLTEALNEASAHAPHKINRYAEVTARIQRATRMRMAFGAAGTAAMVAVAGAISVPLMSGGAESTVVPGSPGDSGRTLADCPSGKPVDPARPTATVTATARPTPTPTGAAHPSPTVTMTRKPIPTPTGDVHPSPTVTMKQKPAPSPIVTMTKVAPRPTLTLNMTCQPSPARPSPTPTWTVTSTAPTPTLKR